MAQLEFLTLAPSVHAVAVGDDLVFLDIAADAYLCLPGASDALPERGRQLSVAPALALMLTDAGLTRSGGPAVGVLPPPRPVRSARDGPLPRPALSDAAVGFRGLVDVASGYAGRPIAEILTRVRGGATVSPGTIEPTPALVAAARRFQAWVPFAPLSGKCLLRSFMLLRLLRREGLDAAWVFGVRTYPFGAHCWLQAGDMVLDDDHERLAAFHPIMAA